MLNVVVAKWHELIKSGDMAGLDEMLADDAIFHSPIVFSPQEGKVMTALYLSAASQVLGGETFHYVREVLDGNSAILEFEVEVDGVYVNGVDMIQINDEGKIDEFKVMLRPLKAINLVHQKMGEMLQQLAGNS